MNGFFNGVQTLSRKNVFILEPQSSFVIHARNDRVKMSKQICR